MTSWPDCRLTELSGITHPIVQAPMSGTATPELAAVVSNVGRLGSLAFEVGDTRAVHAACDMMRGLTDGAFKLNFFVLPPVAVARLQVGAELRARHTDTMVSDAISGRAARARRSRYAEVVADLPGKWPSDGALYALSGPIEEASTAGGGPVSFHLYVQAAGLNREMAAADLVAQLVVEAQAHLRMLGAVI